MPATSRSGEPFCRRSASGRSGSPSKSMIVEVVLDDQHLAEMVVAVEARLQRLEAAAGSSSASAGGSVAPAPAAARPALRRRRQRVAAAREVRRARAPRRRRARPNPPDRPAVIGSGAKAGSLGIRAERTVQLGGAPAELRGELEIERMRQRLGVGASWPPRGAASCGAISSASSR